MNDKFTERIKKVLFMARDEAGRLQHNYIGTEHFLLGVVREGHGVAAKVLQNLGVSLEQIRKEIEERVGSSGDTLTIGEIPFTSGAKHVLEMSVEEARLMGHDYIGTEHLLLALLRDRDDVVSSVLGHHRVSRKSAREEVLKALAEIGPRPLPKIRRRVETPFETELKRLDAVVQLLIRKGLITQEELDTELGER